MMINLKVVIIILIFFIAGFIIGVGINDFPMFTWDREVSVASLANLLLTIIVGLLIPLSLSPLLTNKRTIKDFLINETTECIGYLDSIKKKIDEIALENKTDKYDRIKINSMISRDLSMKLSSLTEQLNLSFGIQSNALIEEINERYKEYWSEMTSGELMSDKFKFDISFCVLHDKNFKKIEMCLKRVVHKINNY
jgi:hypothetical protein